MQEGNVTRHIGSVCYAFRCINPEVRIKTLGLTVKLNRWLHIVKVV